MSLCLFFNTIEISSVGTLPYSIGNMSKWNHWIQLQKVLCIEKVRANAIKPPSVIYDKLTDFFTTLTSLGLLDQTETTIQSITKTVADLLSKNPTH